jgi:hypothetical protein
VVLQILSILSQPERLDGHFKFLAYLEQKSFDVLISKVDRVGLKIPLVNANERCFAA